MCFVELKKCRTNFMKEALGAGIVWAFPGAMRAGYHKITKKQKFKKEEQEQKWKILLENAAWDYSSLYTLQGGGRDLRNGGVAQQALPAEL